MDFESKYTGEEVEGILDSVLGKQDTLVSGENIKTVNGQSLLGRGDVSIPKGDKGDQGEKGIDGKDGADGKSFSYSDLTDAEKIDLASYISIPDGSIDEKQLSEKVKEKLNDTFSGDYDDLTNKPAIPSAVTEYTVSGWGFTKNTGTYIKPSGGIPNTDLASDVQSLLNKADSALQEVPSTYASKQDVSDAILQAITTTLNTEV